MGHYVGEVSCDAKTYNIETAHHLFENREMQKGTSKYHRGQHIDERRYKQIIKKALYNGLTSFRNKGVAVITFYSDKRRPFGVLVDLNDLNNIFVITVFRGPVDMALSRCFIKVHNRINLVNKFTMRSMNDKELQKRHIQKVKKLTEVTAKEDATFLEAMQH